MSREKVHKVRQREGAADVLQHRAKPVDVGMQAVQLPAKAGGLQTQAEAEHEPRAQPAGPVRQPSQESAKRQPKGALITKACGYSGCGKHFTARLADHKRGWALYCSKSCKSLAQAEQKKSTTLDLTKEQK